MVFPPSVYTAKQDSVLERFLVFHQVAEARLTDRLTARTR
jgi:hypothetical protein